MTKQRRGGEGQALQLRYSALQALWWAITCSCCGFAAIFLGSKGMSSTWIGIVTGGASICSIVLSQLFASLLQRIRVLDIPRMLSLLVGATAASFLLISFLPVPQVVVGALYLLVYAVLVAAVPFLAQLSMDYIREGASINFGLARGCGSISYATSAVVLSMLVEHLDSNILSVVYLACSLLFLAVVNTMPPLAEREEKPENPSSHSISTAQLIQKHPVLFSVLTGFMLCMIASTCLQIYLIDIVENVGGDTAMYGVAIFCMAASELPAMAIVPRLRRRLATGTLFAVAGVAYLLRNLIVAFAPNVAFIFVGLAFQSASYGILTSLLTYFISEECGTEGEIRGQTLLAVMTTGIGSTVGTVAGGALQDAFGIMAMSLFAGAVTVVGSMMLVVLGLRDRKVHPARPRLPLK